ncbi:hypothetical protein PY68_12525 [Lacticaseibacillus rhamnosus]|nr:hypothetical protein PY68_12525 [Lacticaseibacillus rhamnosus]
MPGHYKIIYHGRPRLKPTVRVKADLKNGFGIPYSIKDIEAVLNVPYNRTLTVINQIMSEFMQKLPKSLADLFGSVA